MLDDIEFMDLKVTLDNVMKERTASNIGMVVKQAELIPLDFEENMWKNNILLEETPEKLRETVLFLLGINLGLRAGDEHYALHRGTKDKPSQLSFEWATNGKRCEVYREDFITKTNDGGLKSFKKDRKVVWIYPSENVVRCPIRLVDKYMSLLPEVGKSGKDNFYLRSLERPIPAQWYSTQVVGRYTLTKVVASLLWDAKLDGYFTNHSLRRTSTTRLFQAGVDRKIVKEFTDHVSDAVDKYQITSDEQKEKMSIILCGGQGSTESKNAETGKDPTLEISVNDKSKSNLCCGACSCKSKVMKIEESHKIGEMINSLLKAHKCGKAKIKLEIKFSDWSDVQ